MATAVELGKAFIVDASVRPYFFSARTAKNDMVIREGTEMLLAMGGLFSSVVLKEEAILEIYDYLWEKLDIIMELNSNYFKLYYDYIYDMLNFYLQIAEDNELYETCTNISTLINFIGE